MGVSFSLLTEDEGLVEVDLSAILDPFGSNQFMSFPMAMSFFQSLCPDPSLLFHPPIRDFTLIFLWEAEGWRFVFCNCFKAE